MPSSLSVDSTIVLWIPDFDSIVIPKQNSHEEDLYKIDRTNKEAFNKAIYVHELMCKQNVAHNSLTLNLLLKFTPDFDTAWKLYQALERDKRIKKGEVSF
ncbi:MULTISPECIES: hypothetical protein [Nostocales]|uniref:Uncharacterized protein n=3 Tax=Nostocales TaxID=1161 RepID=A0A0C1RCP0_9CYAN|nr:hypothetical protein [Tolypothrix bouteillei]KAF3885916.1 hypothetical protein DA73_0400010875 [Tolypothrix bouteillei VB521301]